MREKERVLNKIRSERVRHGITQEELGRQLGVSRQTIIAIERGRDVPSVLLALKIAKFFKKPMEELFHLL